MDATNQSRQPHAPSEANRLGPATVEVTAESISCRFANGEVRSMQWSDLQQMLIQTISDGPDLDDVFWVLIGEKCHCTIPNGSPGLDRLLEHLERLPGFDHDAFVSSMACTEDRVFLCWQREGMPQICRNQSAIIGCVLGTAVGDALGLPYEELSPRRASRLLGQPDRYRLFFGRGMVSDDTEHTCMVAQALIAAGDDPDAFARDLAWRLRFWLLGLPAGIGLATLKSILKLWIGFPPHRSGVWSAGNGPAMRSAIIGAAVDDLERMKQLVRVSTRLTHTDPKAEYGALAVALAAKMGTEGPVTPEQYLNHLRELLPGSDGEEFIALIQQVTISVAEGQSIVAFAASLGLSKGVTGYIYHTVPVVIHAWLTHQRDFRRGIVEIIQCGGDADSTAAILGGMLGATGGQGAIPPEWLKGLWEWPRTVKWMEELGRQLALARVTSQTCRPPRLSWMRLMARNLGFLVIVLVHGFRRLLPPY